jgi:hypothetical protein
MLLSYQACNMDSLDQILSELRLTRIYNLSTIDGEKTLRDFFEIHSPTGYPTSTISTSSCLPLYNNTQRMKKYCYIQELRRNGRRSLRSLKETLSKDINIQVKGFAGRLTANPSRA